MRSLKKKYLLLGLCLTVEVVCAANGIDSSHSTLSKIFGSVNGVLMENDGIVALLFKIFNVAVLILASFFMGISVMQAVIQTAMQGTLMGKKGGQSAYFTILRTASGLILAFPAYNGYSIVQAVMMMLVIKSTALASTLSHTILEQSMRYSPELLFAKSDNNDKTAKRKIEARLAESRLEDEDVQSFYRALIKNAVCAVQYNRYQGMGRITTPSRLYNITDKSVEFVGCENRKIQLRDHGVQNPPLQNGLRLLIDPVVRLVFHKLDKSPPKDVSADYYKNQPMPKFLGEVQRYIEQNHDLMAPFFVMSVMEEDKDFVRSDQLAYLGNWIEFPLMYQSLMDVKASGQSVDNLEELVKKAYEASDKVADDYTSLSHYIMDAEGSSIHYDQFVDKIVFKSAVKSIQKSGETKSLLDKVKERFTGDPVILRSRIQSHVGQLTQENKYPNKKPKTLQELWDNPSTFDDDINSFLAEQRALQEPIRSFVYHSTEEWVNAYVDNMSGMVLSPSRKLGEVAANMGAQSTLFMFTILRNVLTSQIMNAWNNFWIFFGTKLALAGLTAGTAIYQEMMWDGIHCLTPSPVTLPSPRRLACNPMLIPVPPFLNPGWGVEMGVVTTGMIVSSIMHFTARVAEDLTMGAFNYQHTLKSQYNYAYYPYIVMAVTPVMVVSNLLAVWIPMLPPLIFFVSVVGWLFAVIEAMVAAPLVLLGMTFPQGHDFLGSAQQALVLSLGVFLRAPLIVIGYFLGMLLLSVSMLALSYGIVPLALGMFTKTAPEIADGFMMYAFMVIVLYVTGSLLTQSLSVMYKLPNRILAWVGGQPTEGVEAEAIQQIQSVVDQQQRSVLGSIQQAGTSAKSAGEAATAQSGAGGQAGGAATRFLK